MRLAAVTRTCVLAALLLAIAGCGTAAPAKTTARPTVRITSPVSGLVVSTASGTGSVTVRLTIANFTLVTAPTSDKAGTGKVWLYENRSLVARLSAPSTTFTLSEGTHTLKAVLVTNGKVVASSATTVISVVAAPNPTTGVPGGTARSSVGSVTLFSKGLPTSPCLEEITAASDGNLWFTDGSGIGRITPAGVITMFTKGLPSTSGTLEIVAGPDGNLWFGTGGCFVFEPGGIGRITPAGVITMFDKGELPNGGAPGNLVAGPDGNLWFTVSGPVHNGTSGTGAIGRITPSGTITLFGKGLPAGTQLYGGLLVGPNRDLWFTADTASGAAIGQVTPSGKITLFTKGLPLGSLATAIVLGPGGNLWFTLSTGYGNTGTTTGTNAIGRITPSGAITLFTKGLPPGGEFSPAQLSSVVLGPDGNLWFADDFGGIGRITPSGTITMFTKGLPPLSSPSCVVAGPRGNLWFTTGIDRNTAGGIGRITVSGKISVLSERLPTGVIGACLVAGPGGTLWLTDRSAIGRITP